MANIIINNKKHTIEMSKSFAKAAARFGTKQYNELQAVRRDYPTFHVTTVSQRSVRPEYKGLNYDFMEHYISEHDDENQSVRAKYEDMRGISQNAMDASAIPERYSTIKDWFLDQYPEIPKFHEDRKNERIQIAKRKMLKAKPQTLRLAQS